MILKVLAVTRLYVVFYIHTLIADIYIQGIAAAHSLLRQNTCKKAYVYAHISKNLQFFFAFTHIHHAVIIISERKSGTSFY